MSLQVWLPLNGSTINQGVAGFQLAAAGITYANSGKIGAESCSGGTITMSAEQTASMFNNKALSIAFWIKPLNATSGIIFGNESMGANNNRKFTIYQWRTGQDLHWSWMNDAASNTFASGVINNALPLNKWTHICITYLNPNIKVYINGVETAQEEVAGDGISNSSTFAYETPILHSSPNRYINDLRIYDHCLSPREVKLLSQGLIAHYKLDGSEIENPNLVNNSYGDVTSTEYMLHRYTFDKTGFGRYLAEGEKCTLTVCFTPGSNFSYFNPHINNGHLGGWMDNILANGTGRQIVTVTSSPSWKYSYTSGGTNYTDPNNAPSMADVCMFNKNTSGGNGSTGTVIHWIKLQLGEHPEAKTWTPSISENPNQYLLEDDCSGYGNHGTCSSPFGLTSDAPRYKNCKNFENNKYINCGRGAMVTDAITVSCWAQANNWSTFDGQFISCTDSGGWGLGYGANTDGHGFEVFCNGGYYGINLNYNSFSPGWHHITATYNGNTIIGYIDGEPIASKNGLPGNLTYNSSNHMMIGAEPGGITPSGYYFNGKISDVRIYATALSAAAVKELYQSSISFLDNGTLQCSEIVESRINLKYNQNGITQTELISEIGYTNKMKIKEVDGKIWARIHWLNLQTDKTYFQSEAEVLECTNASNRFSLMKYVDKFKSKEGKYEFMLTYPLLSTTGYNSWTQTGSPNVNYGTNVGYVKGRTDFPHDSYVGPLTYTHSSYRDSSMYSANKSSNWWSPIGQKTLYGDGIPASTATTTYETELWVRIDNLPKLTKLSMLDDAIQAYQIYEL